MNTQRRYTPKTKPYPHQTEAFEKLKGKQIFALLADMGTGKSKITIDLSAHLFHTGKLSKVVVVGPKAVHPQWIDEQFPTHCPVRWFGFSYFSTKTLTYLRKLDRFLLTPTENYLKVLSINFESFARTIGEEVLSKFIGEDGSRTLIVIDEASRIKNPSTKTVRSLVRVRNKYPKSYRAVLTGTPAAKSPADMWSIYEFLKPNYMGCSYTAFVHEHVVLVKQKTKVKGRILTYEKTIDAAMFNKIKSAMHGYIDEFGGMDDYDKAEIMNRYGLTSPDFHHILRSESVVPYKNIEKLKAKIEPDTFSVNKRDCLELPPKQFKSVTFPLNPKQRKVIKQLEKYSLAVMGDKELTIEVKAMLGLRILQICGGFMSHHTDIEGEYEPTEIGGVNYKLDFIKNTLPEIGDQQFMVWAVFKPELRMLEKELNKITPVGMLYGETATADRQQHIADFKAGHLQGLCMHPGVGGYGLNFQNSPVEFWYSRNYRTEDRLQALNRNYRIGTTQSPICFDLLSDCYWERKVLSNLNQGEELNEQFITLGGTPFEKDTSQMTFTEEDFENLFTI